MDAERRLTIDKPPSVLTIHLKRFGEFGGLSGMFGYAPKITKHVEFDDELDIAKFMSQPPPAGSFLSKYTLYGVLVHAGHSTTSGHYYSFVKSPAGIWNLMDDSHVSSSSKEKVLAQRAYMLFYIRKVRPASSPAARLPPLCFLLPAATGPHRRMGH